MFWLREWGKPWKKKEKKNTEIQKQEIGGDWIIPSSSKDRSHGFPSPIRWKHYGKSEQNFREIRLKNKMFENERIKRAFLRIEKNVDNLTQIKI